MASGAEPLEGCTILLARSRPYGDLAERIEALGGTLRAVAVTEQVLEPDAPAALLSALERRAPCLLAVSSAISAEILRGLRQPAGVVVAAVGTATAAALEQVGWTVAVLGPRATGASLAEAIVADGYSSVVVLEAAEAAGGLTGGLVAAGLEPEVVVGYRTLPRARASLGPKELEAIEEASVAVVLAGSHVEALQVLGVTPVLVTVGERARMRAEQLGFRLERAMGVGDLEGIVEACCSATGR